VVRGAAGGLWEGRRWAGHRIAPSQVHSAQHLSLTTATASLSACGGGGGGDGDEGMMRMRPPWLKKNLGKRGLSVR